MCNPKLSNREVREGYPVIFVTGYCQWQGIIRLCDWPKAGHASGYLGWNWDCFHIKNNMCVVTGYRGFPKSTHEADYKAMEKFEHEADELSRGTFDRNYKRKREGFKRRVENYLQKVVDEEYERRVAKRREKEAKDAAKQNRNGLAEGVGLPS